MNVALRIKDCMPLRVVCTEGYHVLCGIILSFIIIQIQRDVLVVRILEMLILIGSNFLTLCNQLLFLKVYMQ